MRRAYPLSYSDYNLDKGSLTIRHGEFHGLFKWQPYFASPTVGEMRYEDILYSAITMMPVTYLNPNISNEEKSLDGVHQFFDLFNELKDVFYGDYYPLTDWNIDNDKWIGWQFMNREADLGFVQMFRREGSPQTEMTVKPRGLEKKAMYELNQLNGKITDTYRIENVPLDKRSGDDMMRRGINVRLDNPGTTCVVKIKKTNK